VSTQVGADNFTGGSGGGDNFYSDGSRDAILPNHTLSDTVVFGEDQGDGPAQVLAITDKVVERRIRRTTHADVHTNSELDRTRNPFSQGRS
jgi:hypothetical protein